MAGHRDHPARHMAQLAQILLSRELDAVAPLGIAGLINDEHPARMRSQVADGPARAAAGAG